MVTPLQNNRSFSLISKMSSEDLRYANGSVIPLDIIEKRGHERKILIKTLSPSKALESTPLKGPMHISIQSINDTERMQATSSSHWYGYSIKNKDKNKNMENENWYA